MNIEVLSAFQDNYIWCIVNPNQASFTCIDPGCADVVLEYAKKHHYTLKSILVTHHHADHSGGVTRLLQTFPNAMVYAPFDSRLTFAYTSVNSRNKIKIDELTFSVLDTPGHTCSHICFYEAHKKWLFCGDTLFSAGCGRVFDGTMRELFDSLCQLKHLPDDTQIYCGHEYTRQNLQFALSIEPDNKIIKNYYNKLLHSSTLRSLPSTLRLEKQINPFLRTDTPELQKYATTQHVDPHDSLAIFQHLREEKNRRI